MESAAGADGSPVHAAAVQRVTTTKTQRGSIALGSGRRARRQDAGDAAAGAVYGGGAGAWRVPWALAKWRGGRCDGVRDAFRQTRRAAG